MFLMDGIVANMCKTFKTEFTNDECCKYLRNNGLFIKIKNVNMLIFKESNFMFIDKVWSTCENDTCILPLMKRFFRKFSTETIIWRTNSINVVQSYLFLPGIRVFGSDFKYHYLIRKENTTPWTYDDFVSLQKYINC